MLNLKKGLALVLAAATAFTFAPVANLSAPVKVEAAELGTKVTIPSTLFDNTSDGSGAQATVSVVTSNDTTIYQLKDGRGFFIENVPVKAIANHLYTVISNNEDGVKVLSNGSNAITTGSSAAATNDATFADTDKDATDASKIYTADTNGYLHVSVWVSTPGAKSILFADKTTTLDEARTHEQTANTTLNIQMNGIKDVGVTNLDIVKWTPADSTNPDTDVKGAASTLGNDKIYQLQLNSADSFYLVKNSGSKIQAWNGMQLAIEQDKANNDVLDPVDNTNNLKIEKVYKHTSASAGKYYLNTNKRPEAHDAGYGVATTPDLTAVADIWKLTPSGSTRNGASDLYVNATSAHTAAGLKQAYTVDTYSLPYTVDRSDNAIDKLTFTSSFTDEIVASTTAGDVKTSKDIKLTTITGGKSWYLEGMDSQIRNKGTINVTAESSDVSFKVDDTDILSFEANGSSATVTAKKPGRATLYVFVTPTDNNKSLVAQVEFNIKTWPTDIINNADNIDLDTQDSTAANAEKSAVLAPTSAGGLKVSMSLQDGKDYINFNDQTGEITSKSIKGVKQVAHILVKTQSDKAKEIEGTNKVVTVTVWSLPKAQFTLDDLVVPVNTDVALKANVTSPNPYSIVWTNPSNSDIYTLSNPNQGLLHTNDQTTSRLFAKKVGTAKYQGEILGTSTTRPTKVTANVTVTDDKITNVITPDDNSKSLVIEVGDTVTINAKSSLDKAVTFDSSKTNGVVTVAAGATSGSAIVTAAKAGKGVIVAKADGASDYEIPVVVTEKQQTVAPAKVTSVKVSNKKGAYVSVKWASQGKNINYRVWKKVGNGKWVGKNVAGSKTTLSVKKGAKVQVKVKSYVKDSTGKTTWGPTATKAKTFKTDKK